MEGYIASDEVATQLKKANLKGLWLRKIASETAEAPKKKVTNKARRPGNGRGQ
jgi:hypothetical protein